MVQIFLKILFVTPVVWVMAGSGAILIRYLIRGKVVRKPRKFAEKSTKNGEKLEKRQEMMAENREDTLFEVAMVFRAEILGLMAALCWWFPRAARKFENLSAYEHGCYLQSKRG